MARLAKYLTLAVLTFAGVGCSGITKSDVNEFRISRLRDENTRVKRDLTKVFNLLERETSKNYKKISDEQERAISWRQGTEKRIDALKKHEKEDNSRIQANEEYLIRLENYFREQSRDFESRYQSLENQLKDLQTRTNNLDEKSKELSSQGSRLNDEVSSLSNHYLEISKQYKELKDVVSFLIKAYRYLDEKNLSQKQQTEKQFLRYRKAVETLQDKQDDLNSRIKFLEQQINMYELEEINQEISSPEPVHFGF